MKKVMMLLVLCGVAQVQALTIKNNSDVTVKVSLDGSATKQQNYVLRAGEATPNIALAPGQVDYVKVDRFYESGKVPPCGESLRIDNADGYGEQQLTIECIGDRQGAVIKPGQLAIIRRDKNNVFYSTSVLEFSGSSASGYNFDK
jgi:hypothetical protein